jgi:hypothetical protein
VISGGDKLIIAYYANDSLLGTLSSNLVVNSNGDVLKDTTVGVPPIIAGSNRHQIIEMIPYPNQQFIITGSGISGQPAAYGFILADSNMNVLDTFHIKLADWTQGAFYQFPNMVSLPSGSLIAGREFSSAKRPSGIPDGTYTGLTKLRAATRFTFDSVVAFYGRDSFDVNYSSRPSLHNLQYNHIDNRIYYANANGLAYGLGFISTCLTPPNYLQVICTDTNLHVYWRKYLQSSNGDCSRITRVAATSGRVGIDIIGMIGNDLYAVDTTWTTSFVYHVDSTGTLDVLSEHISLRDRVRIYPNPTSGVIQVDDLLNGIVSISVIDMLGKEVLRYGGQRSPVSFTIANREAGNYLVKVLLSDGSSISKIISRMTQ